MALVTQSWHQEPGQGTSSGYGCQIKNTRSSVQSAVQINNKEMFSMQYIGHTKTKETSVQGWPVVNELAEQVESGTGSEVKDDFSTGTRNNSQQKISLLSTHSEIFAFRTLYMLESSHFNLRLSNLLHVAIVKYSAWA